MSHEELIAVLDDLDIALSNGFGKASTFIACTKAVRKVIEMHKPYTTAEQTQFCVICATNLDDAYPCETVQAIESELNNG
jgi:hypothetical protein